MDAGATTEPSDRLPDGVRRWQQDGGWYLGAGEQRQGPFLYRPTVTAVWERAGTTGEPRDPVVMRYTRFDAAGEQVTFCQEYRVDSTRQRRLVRTSLVETPPSPEAYEGLENPALPSSRTPPERN